MRRIGRDLRAAVPFDLPPVMFAIATTCIVLWFVSVATRESAVWDGWLALSVKGMSQGRVWQLLTYQFLHSVLPLHVIFNIFWLVVFGRALERRWGGAGFLRFFLTCGVGGGLLFTLVSLILRDGGHVVGASGAVLGCAVAFAFIWPNQLFGLIFFTLTARQLVFLIALIDLMTAWLGYFGGSATGALAHVGGMLTAWLYLRFFGRILSGMRSISPWRAIRTWWRRRRLKVTGRNFDEWLDKQDDRTRH